MDTNGSMIGDPLPDTFDQLEKFCSLGPTAMDVAMSNGIPIVEEKSRLEMLEGRTADWFQDFDWKMNTMEARLGDGTCSFKSISNDILELKGQFNDMKSMLSGHIQQMSEEMFEVRRLINNDPCAGAMEKCNCSSPIPEPQVYVGSPNARELENFLFDIEHRFIAQNVEEAQKATLVSNFLEGEARYWWKTLNKENDAAGSIRVMTWDVMKEGLGAQFLPSNSAWLAREKMRELKQVGTPRAYTRSFSSLMLQVRGMTEEDQMFQFLSGLKPWVNAELKRCDVQDIASAISSVKGLAEYKSAEDLQSQNSKGKEVAYEMAVNKKRKEGPKDEAVFPTAKKFKGCFICKGLHFACNCPERWLYKEVSFENDHGGRSNKTHSIRKEGTNHMRRSELVSISEHSE